MIWNSDYHQQHPSKKRPLIYKIKGQRMDLVVKAKSYLGGLNSEEFKLLLE
jgi:hypothetical protein